MDEKVSDESTQSVFCLLILDFQFGRSLTRIIFFYRGAPEVWPCNLCHATASYVAMRSAYTYISAGT